MSVHVRRAQLRLFSILLVFAALAPGWARAEGLHRPFDRIVVFGTSLSDPGNAFALSHQHLEPPYVHPALNPLTLIPESEWPYKVGGDRFSNGPTWVEHLARPIGLSQSVKPAYVQSIAGSANYAVGGARARPGVAGEVTLSDQIGRFLVRNAGEQSPAALFVIEVGSNDLNDALSAAPADRPAIVSGALGAVAAAINALYHQAGARKFLVWNVPNLGRTPAIRTLDELPPFAGIAAGAEALSRLYNHELGKILEALPHVPVAQGGVPGAQIIPFDAFGRLESVVAHPRRYGLQNVTQACIEPGTRRPSRCDHQDRYLFWDGIHPTRAGHAIVAVEVGKALIADRVAH